MDFKKIIGRIFFLFARTRIERSLAFSFLLVVPVISSGAPTAPFILGQDSKIHGIALDRAQDQNTLNKMGITTHCAQIKKQPSAMPRIGSEGAWLDMHAKNSRGFVVLEGLQPGSDTKILSTRFFSPYKNYPVSIPSEIKIFPGSRYPLALTFAAKVSGKGDLIFQSGDSIVVHADGQLYVYALPAIQIPSEGVLRVYLGTDDRLYFDAALTHPVHAGPCGSTKK